MNIYIHMVIYIVVQKDMCIYIYIFIYDIYKYMFMILVYANVCVCMSRFDQNKHVFIPFLGSVAR